MLKEYPNYQCYLKRVDNIIKNYVNTQENKQLKEAFILLLKGGKRLRPIIATVISDILNSKNNTNYNINDIIVANELIHSASLILDDLPCMDNDLIRRGNPTIHAKYGVTNSNILVMYLLSEFFNLIRKNLFKLKLENRSERTRLIFNIINENLGIEGAPFGQLLDINYLIGKGKQKTIELLLEKKTATFFQIAFLSSYISCNGDLKKLNVIKRLAKIIGIAFQISDDFSDTLTDINVSPNIANDIGIKKAKEKYTKYINEFKEIIKKEGLSHNVFTELTVILDKRVYI